jgi:NAD(P)-dependent dehydrogenase (short-subunit alcohol dehydrogenase family)
LKKKSMNNNTRIALITGANRGIGLETARQLTQQHIFVIVTARDAARLAETKTLFEKEGLHADFHTLDVTDMDSVRDTAAYITGKYGVLDILINNAAIAEGIAKPPLNNTAVLPMTTLKHVFETNVFGLIAVTQALLPLLRKSREGRIVNLSSGLGSLTLHSDPTSYLYRLKNLAYNSSKSAVNQFTIHLAEALHDTSIKVNSVSPGWVRTDLGGPDAPMSVADGARIIVKAATLPGDGPTGSYFTHEMRVMPW